MPRIIPEPRYFSMPSIEVGADVRMKRALNCWPWVWSLTHSPDAVIHSPAEIVAAWPMTVTRSRWPRAFARRTQKPFSRPVVGNRPAIQILGSLGAACDDGASGRGAHNAESTGRFIRTKRVMPAGRPHLPHVAALGARSGRVAYPHAARSESDIAAIKAGGRDAVR